MADAAADVAKGWQLRKTIKSGRPAMGDPSEHDRTALEEDLFGKHGSLEKACRNGLLTRDVLNKVRLEIEEAKRGMMEISSRLMGTLRTIPNKYYHEEAADQMLRNARAAVRDFLVLTMIAQAGGMDSKPQFTALTRSLLQERDANESSQMTNAYSKMLLNHTTWLESMKKAEEEKKKQKDAEAEFQTLEMNTGLFESKPTKSTNLGEKKLPIDAEAEFLTLGMNTDTGLSEKKPTKSATRREKRLAKDAERLQELKEKSLDYQMHAASTNGDVGDHALEAAIQSSAIITTKTVSQRINLQSHDIPELSLDYMMQSNIEDLQQLPDLLEIAEVVILPQLDKSSEPSLDQFMLLQTLLYEA